MGGAYQSSLALDWPVFIDASSSLISSQPQYVTFTQVALSANPYRVADDDDDGHDDGHGGGGCRYVMRGVTRIEPGWLFSVAGKPQVALRRRALEQQLLQHKKNSIRSDIVIEFTGAASYCHIGKPLELPRPIYDASSDAVLCSVPVRYGRHGWQLQNQRADLWTLVADPLVFYRHFLRLMLCGQVFPQLVQFRSCLLVRPDEVLSPLCPHFKKVDPLLLALQESGIRSRPDCQRIWHRKPNWLRREFEQCVTENMGKRDLVANIWPPTQ
jgi:hypothetical protein